MAELIACFAVLVVKSPILPVDVNVPAGLHVNVALHGATLLLPMKQLGFMLRQCLVQWIPAPLVLFHKLAPGQPYLLPFRFMLDLGHIRALVRNFTAQHLRQLLAVAGEDLSVLCPA